MRLRGLLDRRQVEDIHRNALRVLEEIGVQVDHESLRQRLASIGGRIDPSTDRVKFAAATSERLIQSATKAPPTDTAPSLSLGCNVYQCRYLDPFTGEYRSFDEELLAFYLGFARSLPLVEHVGMLGVPFVPRGVSPARLPLAEKLYAWKNGARPGGSVHSTELCEPLLEMFEIHASASGVPVSDVFSACGFMISPLRLARPECEQVLFFAERGLRMFVGHLPSQGATAPVTFAGTLVLVLAEQLFLHFLERAVWGDCELCLGAGATTIDMRTALSCYGRPERQRVNIALADIADFYGCACAGHTGCADAYAPSYEAGVQKAQGALVTALATGGAFIEAGLLGVDEICSPVQMMLDHDLAASLRSLLAEPQVSDAECAFDEISAAGVGGHHLGTEFTASRFRECLFEPETWSNQSLSAALASGVRTDVDKARDRVADFGRGFVALSYISEDEERALRAVVEG